MTETQPRDECPLRLSRNKAMLKEAMFADLAAADESGKLCYCGANVQWYGIRYDVCSDSWHNACPFRQLIQQAFLGWYEAEADERWNKRQGDSVRPPKDHSGHSRSHEYVAGGPGRVFYDDIGYGGPTSKQ